MHVSYNRARLKQIMPLRAFLGYLVEGLWPRDREFAATYLEKAQYSAQLVLPRVDAFFGRHVEVLTKINGTVGTFFDNRPDVVHDSEFNGRY